MQKYICGISLEAMSGEEALLEVLPVTKLIQKASFSETVTCIESPSIGIPLVIISLVSVMIISTLFGYWSGINNNK